MLKSSQPRDPDERKQFTQEQLTARELAARLERLEDAALLLRPALRAAELAGLDITPLGSLMQSLLQQHDSATARAGSRIVPRSRPAVQKNWRKEGPRNRFRLFIDESGGSRLNIQPRARYFAIGGLLISEPAYTDFENRWTQWKVDWIGNERASMHAKNLSKKSIKYYARVQETPEQALSSLDELIDGVDCCFSAVVINKAEFQKEFLHDRVNELLPGSHYDMCLDFLLERVVYYLLENDDAHAHVFAESRNRSEDAKLQLEYQRLQIEGTLFQADTWFRYQLGPHITFHEKDDNVAGLQLVDVLLKSLMDRLLAPSAEPLRWGVTRQKLYDGGRGRISGWGLKIFPASPVLVDAVLSEEQKTEGVP